MLLRCFYPQIEPIPVDNQQPDLQQQQYYADNKIPFLP
jgi:hypothetical protein